MEVFTSIVVLIWFVVATVLSGTFLFGDFRDFHHIKQQCSSLGYIQNTDVRINCSLEERK